MADDSFGYALADAVRNAICDVVTFRHGHACADCDPDACRACAECDPIADALADPEPDPAR